MADPDPQQQASGFDPSKTFEPVHPSGFDPNKPIDLSPSSHPLIAEGVSQFFSDLNPMNMAKLIAENPGDPLGAMVRAMGTQSAERLKAAKQAANSGDHAQAALHYLGAIPFIGAPIDDLFSSLRTGDKEGAARAAGSVAAVLAPGVLSGGAAEGAAAVAPRIADAAEARATGNIASAMGPTNGWGRSAQGRLNAARAAEVAPDVLAAKPPYSLSATTFDKFIDKNFKAVSDAWDTAEANRLQGTPINTQPIIERLQSRLDALNPQPVQGSLPQRTAVTTTSPILGPNGQPIQTTTMQAQPIGQSLAVRNQSPQAVVIQKAIDDLKKLGPITTYDELRKFRKDADIGSDYRPSIAAKPEENTASEQSARGNRVVAGETRDALAANDPALAKANAPFSIWKAASDVRDAADDINRAATKGGSFAVVSKLMPAVLGALGGGATGIPGAAEVGGFIGAALKMAKDSGYSTQVATARAMSDLADAIRSGNATRVFRSLAAVSAASGATVPALNQSLPAGPSVTIGDTAQLDARTKGGS